ncbi:hypothetical protein DOE76_06765 [Leifsonia sp. ku-ls]|nr:hypothetical protein DOE76_06765 [Leifsonia sp. ku-ls]
MTRDRIVERYRGWVQPAPSGLPNWRVVVFFPAAVLVVLIAFVGLGLTGSSTGVLHSYLSTSSDPELVAGQPEPIRSDEWFVQTSWTVSQVEQGLPIRNHVFPGGMDATVQHDLPSTDWSVAFRPHLLGFLFLPLDNAMALKWWLPGFAMIVACYLFLVALLPRRPIMAAAVSVGFFFAPFFQWWYLSITFWPAAWAFLVMAGAVWLLRSRKWSTRITWAAVVGYVTVTVGMGIYVPFIIAAALVVLAFVIGLALTRWTSEIVGFGRRLLALLPLIVGGVAAVAVLGVWILTRFGTIELFLGTVYPGQRLHATGGMTKQSLFALLGAPVTSGLAAVGGQPLSSNTSEAATFFFVGLFLIVPLAWFLIRDRRRKQPTDWMTLLSIVAGLVVLAYLFVPGWDIIAHLTLLDRTTSNRIRMALGILSIVAMALMVLRSDRLREEEGVRVPWWAAWSSFALFAATVWALTAYLGYLHAPILGGKAWIVVTVLYGLCVLSYGRGWGTTGGILFLVFSIIGSAGANPLYRGVYDLNQTDIVKSMKTEEKAEPGRWVGVGDGPLPNAILVQSGLPGYNGFQSAPSPQMWRQIDPAKKYEFQWNRLANVSWRAATGPVVASNPAPDQIKLTFDSCSAFAQRYVTHVLSDAKLDQPCLDDEKVFREGPSTLYTYDVAK